MERCPACGAVAADGSRFCASCGASLVAACSQCGAELPPDARFCPACGARVAAPAPPPAGHERRLVTVLFADVSGSTGIGERLDPERVTEVMSAYFAAMKEEIEAEGGTVEKFAGDAVMAAFGVPTAHEDDPSRAVRASLRMQRRLGSVNAELERTHGVSLEIRIGINTGDVLAAVVPAPGEAMVAGDAVNVAARLEQGAERGQIVVSERTARAARGFRYRELGALRLRGREGPLRALAVLGEANVPERGLPGLRAPMIGRDRELAFLRTVYERAAAEGRPHLVTVYGQPGVGKSRLVAEFLAAADTLDPRPAVLRGRCLPYGEGVTYWPLAEMLKSRAGVQDSDPPEVTLAAIRRMGAELERRSDGRSSDAARMAAALAYTIGIEDPEVPLGALPPRQVHAEMQRAWRAFFSAQAARGPVVAIVEDIHWGDPALLGLVEGVVERAEGPLLLVCPTRPELSERSPGWGGGRGNSSSIVLEPLPRADADRLVRILLSIEDLPESVHARILERAEGNPFFLEEILRQLIDEGHVVHEDGAWRSRGELEQVSIPDTVQAVLAARIDLLGPADRRVLQNAAVVGRVFWPGPLHRLLNGESGGLTDALGRLEERDLVLSRLGSALAGEPEFIFKHALIRDVAYESLPRRERPAAHAAVAGWIEETAGERRLEFVELLAYHYLEAYRGSRDAGPEAAADERRERAFAYLLLASRDARSKLAVAKAQHLADMAVEVAHGELERSRALEALGEAFHADFRGDEAWRALRAAADARLAAGDDDPRAVAHICARAVEMPTRWPGVMRELPAEDEVRRYLELGFERAGDGDSPERARLLTARAMLPFGAAFSRDVPDDELEAASRDAQDAVEMASRLDEPTLESAALDGVTSVQIIWGRYAAAAAGDDRRLALVPRLSDSSELGDLHATAAIARFHLGRYRETVELGVRGAELALADAPSFGMYGVVWQVMGLFRLGDWDGALDTHRRLETLLGERWSDPPRPYVRAYSVRAFMHEARGERGAADRQLAMLDDIGDVQRTRSAIGQGWVALTLARRGDFAGAREWLARLRWREGQGLKLEALCDLIAEEGTWDEAPATVREAREHSASGGLLALPCFADRLEGRAALADGDAEQAVRSLTAASRGFRALEARWEQACTDLSLGEALLRAGRPEDAAATLAPALEVFERVSSRREVELCRRLLASPQGIPS